MGRERADGKGGVGEGERSVEQGTGDGKGDRGGGIGERVRLWGPRLSH